MSYDSFFKKHEKQRRQHKASFEEILERLGKRDLSLLGIDSSMIDSYMEATHNLFITQRDTVHTEEQIREVARKDAPYFIRTFLYSLYKKDKPMCLPYALINPVYMDEIIKCTVEADDKDDYPMFTNDSYMVISKIVRDFNIHQQTIIERNRGRLYNKLAKVYYGWFIDRHMDYIKSIERVLYVSRDNAVELAIRCPLVQEQTMIDKAFLHKNAGYMLTYLYSLAVDTVEITEGHRMDSEEYINNVFNLFFPFHIDQLLLTVFLESKRTLFELTEPQKAVWSTVTVCALDILESWEYDEIRNLIELYGVMLLNASETHIPRVSLQQTIAQDDYRKIIQVCDDVIADYSEFENLL